MPEGEQVRMLQKKSRDTGMLDNARQLFRDFSLFIKFLAVRREDVTKMVYAPPVFKERK